MKRFIDGKCVSVHVEIKRIPHHRLSPVYLSTHTPLYSANLILYFPSPFHHQGIPSPYLLEIQNCTESNGCLVPTGSRGRTHPPLLLTPTRLSSPPYQDPTVIVVSGRGL